MGDKNTAEEAKILPEEAGVLTKDGLENLVANLNTGQDKRSAGEFVNRKRLSAKGNEDELTSLYRTDWLSGKVVDIIPNDMTREWRSFIADIDPDKIQEIVDEEDRLQLAPTFNEAHKWARLYGTSLIVMSIDDGQNPEQPVDINRVKPGSLKHIKAVDQTRFNMAETIIIDDPLDPNYGYPRWYRFTGTNSQRIHHSRVLRFDGVKIPFYEFQRNNYTHDSVLDRLYESIMNFNVATTSSSSMIYETNVDIIKIKGLMNYLQTDMGEETIRKRFALAKMLKSFNNQTLLDSEEDYDTKANTFAGLPDLIREFAQHLSAATDIPATRLLGTSASGLNATGEGDLKNYYDMIASRQRIEYKPMLDYFDIIMAKSLGMEDDELEYEFNPLFQMSPNEKADIDLKNAQRDATYIDRDVIPVSTVAKELKQQGTYTNIDDDYIEELEEIESEEFDNDDDLAAITNPSESEVTKEADEEGEAREESEESGGSI